MNDFSPNLLSVPRILIDLKLLISSSILLSMIAKWSGKGLNGSLDDDLTLLVVDVETGA